MKTYSTLRILVIAVTALTSLFVTALVLLAFGDDFYWNWRSSAILESQRRGLAIARAIDLYKAKNNTYPGRLGDLVPKYIDTVPPPTAGEGVWEYKANNVNSWYMLRFGMPTKPPYYFYPNCTLDSTDKTWYMDD